MVHAARRAHRAGSFSSGDDSFKETINNMLPEEDDGEINLQEGDHDMLVPKIPEPAAAKGNDVIVEEEDDGEIMLQEEDAVFPLGNAEGLSRPANQT